MLAFFRGRDYPGISPQKLGRALTNEMDNRKQAIKTGFQVPAIYYVYLGHDDFYIIKPMEQEYISQLFDILVEHIANNRYNLDGQLEIIFDLDVTFRRGQFATIGSYSKEARPRLRNAEELPEQIEQVMSEAEAEAKQLEDEKEDLKSETVEEKDKEDLESETVYIQSPKTQTQVAAMDIRKKIEKFEEIVEKDTQKVLMPDTIRVSVKRIQNGFLQLLQGDIVVDGFPLNKDLVSMGRSRVCDIHLYDKTVSRVHAYVRFTDEGYVIYDFNSRNGIYVNERKITEGVLTSGDKIRLGETVLLFEER